jgi:putative SOS response-associated peptidase YedK
MCGRFAAQLPAELVARLFRTVNPLPNLAPNWNLAPTQPAMVIRRHPQSGERHLDVLRWGLVPSFTKDLKTARRPFNARSETIASAPMFRSALASRRCLVPADAFYEWQKSPGGKQPFAIARADSAPLVFAGLWESWRDSAGEILRTFVIATTSANADLAWLHDRMPVILEPDAWTAWLGEAPADPLEFLRPAAHGVLRWWPVSQAVNSVRNNSADLLVACSKVGLF